MRKRACTIHAEGKGHLKNCKIPSVYLAAVKKKSKAEDESNKKDSNVQDDQPSLMKEVTKPQSKPFLGLKLNLKNPALGAEIRWALTAVGTNQSDNSQDNISDVFNVAFSEDPAGSAYSCKRTKIVYLVKFGIFPYFHNELFSNIK